MNEPTLGLLGLCVLILLLFMKVPLGFAMAFIGFVGFSLISGWEGALSNLAAVPFRYLCDYNFVVLPLFLLMGNIASNTGISRDLYVSANVWFGRMRGGLCIATVGAAAAFSAICGSSTATAASVARIAYPEMVKLGYDPRLATGALAAGGTMGILIPPSIAFVTYAILTEESVGKLFMAGIIPGVLEAIFYMITIFILCTLNPALGPKGAKSSFKEKITSLKRVWAMLTLFLLVMGGIYGGVFTPTEAAAIGSLGALLIGVVSRRLSTEGLFQSLRDTCKTTAMISLLIVGSMIFQRFMAVSNLPFYISDLLSQLQVSKYIVFSLILCFYVVAGCFLDVFSVLVLTVPIIFPTIKVWGFDPIWFGVIFVRIAEIGLITPPFGLNAFVIAGTTGESLNTVFRGILPFVLADFCHVALLIAVPEIVLFLPRTMD